MSRRVFNLLCAVISLCIGGIFYVLLRPNSHIAQTIDIDFFFSQETYFHLKPLSFFLPDFLWSFSLSGFLISLYPQRKFNWFLCPAVAFMLGIVWEVSQWLGVISGTGDFLDILMYFSAATSVAVINLKGSFK